MIHKPHRWLYSLNGLEYPDLWRGVAFVAPFLQMSAAGKVTLLDARGRPLNGANLTANGTEWRGSPYGLALGNSNDAEQRRLVQTGFAPITTSDGAGTGDFTIIILANPRAEARVAVGLAQRYNSAPTNQCRLDFNTSADSTSSGSFSFYTHATATSSVGVSGVVDGGWHMFGGVRIAGKMTAWVDGVARATSTPTLRGVYNSGAVFCIGGFPTVSSAGMYAGDTVAFASGWNRALNDAEMRLLARDPFAMFRSRRDWVMKAAAAGGADVRNHIIPAYMRIAA